MSGMLDVPSECYLDEHELLKYTKNCEGQIKNLIYLEMCSNEIPHRNSNKPLQRHLAMSPHND